MQTPYIDIIIGEKLQGCFYLSSAVTTDKIGHLIYNKVNLHCSQALTIICSTNY
jgi:hypothetical protein